MSDKTIDHTDKDTLEYLYAERGMTQSEIAEISEVNQPTIGYHIRKHGIETRDSSDYEPPNKKARATFHTRSEDGYECWAAWYRPEDSVERVRVHRLLAVAEYGYDAVVGKDIHHKNEIPWDNRPENITPMDKAEHIGHHHRGERCPNAKLTESDVKEVREKLQQTDLKNSEIADEYGVSRAAIRDIDIGKNWAHVE
jgi:DNA-binding XRE family transcriptional regulator